MRWVAWMFSATCAACGTRLRIGTSTVWCQACQPGVLTSGLWRSAGRLPVAGALAYGGPVIEAVLRAKIGGRLPDTHGLTRPLRPLVAHLAGSEPVALVPVPPARVRLVERGFHLPDLLADALARHDRPVCRVLHRLDNLPSRRANRDELPVLRGTAPLRWTPRRAVILDDVVTTGATVRTAAQVLAERGWEVLGAVCLADARPEVLASVLP